jgi:hypothetical protein
MQTLTVAFRLLAREISTIDHRTFFFRMQPCTIGSIYYEVAAFMGWGIKYVVLLAALSVLVVLITPAPDELPCTAGCKSLQPPAFLASVSAVLVPPPRLEGRPSPAATRFFGVADVLALTCIFLC